MDHAFFGADPSQLRVGDEVAPGDAPVGDEGGEGSSADTVGDVVYGVADDVVAAADCECLFSRNCQYLRQWRRKEEGWRGGEYHSMTGEFRVGFEDTVCSGVITCCIHGIGASLIEGRRKSYIASVPAGDGDFCHGVAVCFFCSSRATLCLDQLRLEKGDRKSRKWGNQIHSMQEGNQADIYTIELGFLP